MSKIFTLADARAERIAADLKLQAKHAVRGTRLFIVVDAQGVTVGQCQTRKAADQFVRDSLNTRGWTVVAVRK